MFDISGRSYRLVNNRGRHIFTKFTDCGLLIKRYTFVIVGCTGTRAFFLRRRHDSIKECIVFVMTDLCLSKCCNERSLNTKGFVSIK